MFAEEEKSKQNREFIYIILKQFAPHKSRIVFYSHYCPAILHSHYIQSIHLSTTLKDYTPMIVVHIVVELGERAS